MTSDNKKFGVINRTVT